MSDEIVRRLMRSRRKSLVIKESLSLKGIREADEDEDLMDTEEDAVDTEEMDDFEIGEDTPEEVEDTPDEDSVSDDSGEEESTASDEYVNPLDNPYAVKFTIGHDVVMTYANGTNSPLVGTIEGYDKEGFYRIKWDNGSTTNGITDLAISDFVTTKKESQCICGGTHFVQESGRIVCDECGRSVKEGSDPLTNADKSRPKGQKLVRSEAHPLNTSLQDSIRKVFGSKLQEEYDDDEDVFARLRDRLSGEFWTRLPELVEDIEDLGYDVDDYNSEYVVVSIEVDGEDYGLQIPLGGTSRTMTLDFERSREA